MELKDIAAISGKPGLYKIVSHTKNGAIVSPLDQPEKKFPVNQHQPLALLEEVTIYGKKNEDIQLKTVMASIKEKYDSELPVSAKDQPEALRDFFYEVAPDHDDNKVYTSDIKKVVKWYNILLEHNMLS